MNDKAYDPLVDGPVKVTRASFSLQDKAGNGEIDPILIMRAQDALDDNEEDFTPFALEYLAKMARIIERIKRDRLTSRDALQELAVPVMHLKANGRMFKYELVSSLAATMLDFLETAESADDDLIALTEAYLAGLQVVIARKIKGDGGPDGQKLRSELEEAIARYAKKHLPSETLN